MKETEEINLISLFKMFWARKIAITNIIVISIAAGFVYTTKCVTPVYTASTKLLLATMNKNEKSNDESITTTEITLNSKLVSTYSELVKSKNVLREVIDNLNLQIEEDSLKNMVSVNAVKNTELIEIRVTNGNSELSANIANEIATVFIEMIKEYYKIENIHIVDKAEIEERASNINHKKDMIMAVVVGMIVSIGYVMLRSLLDTTVKTEEEIEKMLDLPVLAAIPVYEVSLKKQKRRANK